MKYQKIEAATRAHIYTCVDDQIQREQEAKSDIALAVDEAIASLKDDDSVVYQWWTVSLDFASRARKRGEIAIETPFGLIWGRQTCGQPPHQDEIVMSIIESLG